MGSQIFKFPGFGDICEKHENKLPLKIVENVIKFHKVISQYVTEFLKQYLYV